MAFKVLIVFAMLAVALGFTLPEENNSPYAESQWVYGDVVPVAGDDDVVLVRIARSPQGQATGAFEYHPQDGSSARFDYTRQVTPNLDVYLEAARNFRYNDNSAQAGLIYRF